ncbi:MAG: ATP-binding protein [Victivallales bacterium]|jgi:predicted AAA+ superfamily ATPase|nr:ATP-binding protein [Victivallales bacterium]
MNYIHRTLESELKRRLFSGKALFLYGPRQCGKTTLLKHLIAEYNEKVIWLNGDNPETRNTLFQITTAGWKRLLGKCKILVLDEAQRIDNIGLSLKLITDELPDIQIIVSGSSAFELMNRTAESLTGRKFEYRLLPFSFGELCDEHGVFQEKQERERRMLFGCYPDVVANKGDEAQRLSEIAGSYLFKDVYALDGLRRSGLFDKLIRALAMQIGSEVSYNELAGLVGTDNKTVERYIELLTQCYIVFPLGAYSGNLRNEIKKGVKIYFYDLGIRNAVINNFTSLDSRNDSGGMWENYVILERIKKNLNQPFLPRCFFWRTRAPQSHEIDYIEEAHGNLHAWEIKSKPNAKSQIPKTFQATYPNAKTDIITPANYEEFLLLAHENI